MCRLLLSRLAPSSLDLHITWFRSWYSCCPRLSHHRLENTLYSKCVNGYLVQVRVKCSGSLLNWVVVTVQSAISTVFYGCSHRSVGLWVIRALD